MKIAKQTGKQIPSILITGTLPEAYAFQVMKAGADDDNLNHRLERLSNAYLKRWKNIN